MAAGDAVNVAQVSAQFVSAAMPTVTISAGIIAFLLAISGIVLRWRNISLYFYRFLLRRPQYNYRKIFGEYLDRFNAINDRRELYPAILSAACKTVSASGASLIVRDSKDRFQIKASQGLKPFSFDVEAVLPFMEWLENNRRIVTRRDLVHSKQCFAIRSEGLSYFVQFNCEASVPLFVNDRLYGVINLGARGHGSYDSETRDVLKLMAIHFTTAIHNANLYQALVKQNLHLQEASNFKTRLLSNLSHELRTPLSSIISLSELMVEGGDGQLSGEQTRHLKIIRQSGSRLLNTVTAMLDISKIEGNRLSLNVQKVNIGRVVHQVAEGIKTSDDTKLEIKVGDSTPGVYGDEARLKQVLRHILDNAAKFTKNGKISVDAEKCGEMLKLRVKDTGIGIAKDRQKMIFEGFTQVDGEKTRGYDGLGLGLTISKKLIELHGGRLWLTSEIGKGSEFFVTLPLKPAGIDGKGSTLQTS